MSHNFHIKESCVIHISGLLTLQPELTSVEDHLLQAFNCQEIMMFIHMGLLSISTWNLRDPGFHINCRILRANFILTMIHSMPVYVASHVTAGVWSFYFLHVYALSHERLVLREFPWCDKIISREKLSYMIEHDVTANYTTMVIVGASLMELKTRLLMIIALIRREKTLLSEDGVSFRNKVSSNTWAWFVLKNCALFYHILYETSEKENKVYIFLLKIWEFLENILNLNLASNVASFNYFFWKLTPTNSKINPSMFTLWFKYSNDLSV